MDYESIRKQISILTALCDSYDAVAAGKIEKDKVAVPIDEVAQKVSALVSARNIALAGSGDKAALMGTLSTEPVLQDKDLIEIGIEEKLAEDIIKERDTIRIDALALTEAKEELIGDSEPLEEVKP